MTSLGIAIGFYALAGLSIGASLLVFFTRNLLHAVIFVILAFIGMAGLFVTLSADFLAVSQVMIYAGAISVLLVFAVMLTPYASRDNGNSLFAPAGVLVGLGFAALIGFVATQVAWPAFTGADLEAQNFTGTVRTIGAALLGGYALPFELASVLLLAALVGAIALVREDER